MQTKSEKGAQKCGVCFFIGSKAHFTIVKTTDEAFNKKLITQIYTRNGNGK